MAQGSKLPRSSKPARGGRANAKHGSKMRKGVVVKKPKRASVATKFNHSRRVTGAITRNIEKEMGHKVQKNGGALSLLKAVAPASGEGAEETEKKGAGAEIKEGGRANA